MALLKRNGWEIHYEFEAKPGLPVLVFSNSLGSDCSMWEPQEDALRGRFALLRYDTRGHGASSVPQGPYSLDELASDLLALLDHLGLTRVHLCGLSLGGLVGQWLALHAPERLDRLVLANTAARIGTPEGWSQRIEAVLQCGIPSLVPSALERWFTHGYRSSNPENVEAAARMLLETDAHGYISSCAVLRDADFRGHLGAITTPTLVVAATHDPVTTVADATYLSTNIPNAQHIELNAAHLSNIEAAESFTGALLSFLLTQPCHR